MSYTSLTMEQGLELEDPQSRIRTLTEKGAEGFSKRSEDYTTQLNAQWAAVENLISTYSSTITNLEYLDKFEGDLSKAYADQHLLILQHFLQGQEQKIAFKSFKNIQHLCKNAKNL